MTQPSHICPKCKGIRPANLFISEKGKPAKWCSYCRHKYRDRLTNLHQRDATKPKREEAIDADEVATREGYANHPLATLLALSHIAGAKRALAIRDGNSWRGKKAWRAYYEAKRALEAQMAGEIDYTGEALKAKVLEMLPKPATFGTDTSTGMLVGRVMRELRGRANPTEVIAIIREWKSRDPNSSGVS